MEDAIETEIVDRLAKGDTRLGWKILRGSLSPTHVMANFVAGKTPWYRYRLDGPDGGSLFNWHQVGPAPKFSFEGIQRWEIGAHYAYLSLAVNTETCASCRVGNSEFGGNFAYRITNHLWIDSDVNHFPGSGNYGKKGNAVEGLFDVGSIFEWHTSAHSAIRFDVGTTVVRYLTGRSDPRQPPGNILSTDYIVSQSNFQIGTGYTYRF